MPSKKGIRSASYHSCAKCRRIRCNADSARLRRGYGVAMLQIHRRCAVDQSPLAPPVRPVRGSCCHARSRPLPFAFGATCNRGGLAASPHRSLWTGRRYRLERAVCCQRLCNCFDGRCRRARMTSRDTQTCGRYRAGPVSTDLTTTPLQTGTHAERPTMQRPPCQASSEAAASVAINAWAHGALFAVDSLSISRLRSVCHRICLQRVAKLA